MEWISVKDRLPQVSKDYLVTDGDAKMVAAFKVGTQRWYFWSIHWWSNDDVTHWIDVEVPQH